MLDVIERAEFSGDIVVSYDVVTVQISDTAEPGTEPDERLT